MFFPIDAWECGPIVGKNRTICGQEITFKTLSLKGRYDLAFEMMAALKDISDAELLDVLSNPELRDLVSKLVALSNCPQQLLEDDLTAQIPVAVTAAEINLVGFFEQDERRMLSDAQHPAVRKAMRKKDDPETDLIGPNIKKYWFLFRPIMGGLCTYSEMFIEEKFSFYDIHRMHEILDVKSFSETVAMERDD